MSTTDDLRAEVERLQKLGDYSELAGTVRTLYESVLDLSERLDRLEAALRPLIEGVKAPLSTKIAGLPGL